MEDKHIRIAPSVYANIEGRRMLARWGWIPALALVVCLIAGIADVRWLFFALILGMLVYPMLISLAWMAIIAKPQMQLLSRPFTVAQVGDHLAIDFYPFEYDEDTEPIEHFDITPDMVTNATQSSRYWCLSLEPNDHKITFLLIPHRSLGSVPQYFYNY